MPNIQAIIKSSREKGTADFTKFAVKTNCDMGKLMITFCTYTKDVRKINDWGRDRDSDVYIGLDQNGWIKYSQEIDNGAGPIQIQDESTVSLTDNDILKFLENCTDEDYLSFMSKANYIRAR